MSKFTKQKSNYILGNEFAQMQSQRSTKTTTRAGLLGFLSLLTSVGTLLCCALPALLVTLGMGMTVASLAGNVPWLFSLSRYKGYMFLASGVLLATSCFVLFRKTARECNGETCELTVRYSRKALWLSLGLYVIGFFTAYLYLPLRLYLEK